MFLSQTPQFPQFKHCFQAFLKVLGTIDPLRLDWWPALAWVPRRPLWVKEIQQDRFFRRLKDLFDFTCMIVEKSFQKTQKWSSVYWENRAKTFRRLRHRRFPQTDDGVDAETFLPDFLNKLKASLLRLLERSVFDWILAVVQLSLGFWDVSRYS